MASPIARRSGFLGGEVSRGIAAPPRPGRASRVVPKAELSPFAGVALFLTPGALGALYALYLGKGNFSDGFSRLITEVSQGYFNPNAGGENVPVCEGELSDLVGDEPLFKALEKWYLDLGGVYKLAFGPKCFLVISDPIVVRHLLKDNPWNYNKGALAEILEPIMGQGLIPADLEVWKPRRKAVVPGFHKAYIESMVHMFGKCTQDTVDALDKAAASGSKVDMETEFLNCALDIIGLGVFNYDFGSSKEQSPVIKSVYGVLKEAEHRATFYIPYWDFPLASQLVPRQRQFQSDIKVINDCLDELIQRAVDTRQDEDIEALQNRDYSQVTDPSLLRFLVDMRGEEATNRQLRDDLMTMLIAGHETTAAVLTWTAYQMSLNPEYEARMVAEIDSVLGDRRPTIEDVGRMPTVTRAISESLRMYPQPPILIRRSLGDDVLPGGLGGDKDGYPIGPGTDLFISVWNLHRSPDLWDQPNTFNPDRFSQKFVSPRFGDAAGWAGYDPEATSGMYPNEVNADFAYIPFGGGMRKCVGDQFALLEAAVCISMLYRRFKFTVSPESRELKMKTGATIHTADGLWMNVEKRTPPEGSAAGTEVTTSGSACPHAG